jgi:hypothetical protein
MPQSAGEPSNLDVQSQVEMERLQVIAVGVRLLCFTDELDSGSILSLLQSPGKGVGWQECLEICVQGSNDTGAAANSRNVIRFTITGENDP